MNVIKTQLEDKIKDVLLFHPDNVTQNTMNKISGMSANKLLHKTVYKFSGNQLNWIDSIKFASDNIDDYKNFIYNMPLMLLLASKSKSGSKGVRKFLAGKLSGDILHKIDKFD